MKKKHKVTILPFDTIIEVQPRTNLLDAINAANLPLTAVCGGEGTCGECVVQITSGRYHSKPSAALSDEIVSEGYALACQTFVEDDLTVVLPRFEELSIRSVVDHEFFDERRDLISGIYEVDPPVQKIDLQVEAPSLEDNYSDLKRIERALGKSWPSGNISCEYSVLKKMAYAVRKDHGKISIVLARLGGSRFIIDIFPQSEKKSVCGLACDIGTSTVALHLVDLSTGKFLGTASSYNQQMKCGEDIISRINYSQKPGRLEELHDLIIGTINLLIKKASESAGVPPADIYYAAISGNTTMIHLFLNLNPNYIREEPYVPTINQPPVVRSQDLGLDLNPEARVSCTPAVGSYVGGDITSGLLCTPILLDTEKVFLFLDAGTNGELVVGNKEWLMTCACSAGPAFEGSGIKCGMPASEGAIETIKIDDKGRFGYEVINNAKPKGLCGSGLVDLLAELFVHGFVDRNGKFIERTARNKIVQTENGEGLLIVEGPKSFWGNDIVITEKDIANLIRTKGAIYSACSMLLKSAGLKFHEIDSVYIAGGFGQHLDIENSVRIGLLPDIERAKFSYLGNSSLLGAYLMLLTDKNHSIVNKIADQTTYIELNTEPRYMNEFTGALFLPHTEMDLFPSVKKVFDRIR
ncbi:MAG: DUF4445 domain-containing protein [Candidatus Latescibacteria bacterium]|nr:DUF4445 domain-containing protein [Candidatus Latescibacterota bacterium]NIO57412.1 DUF4445 domain-containing protein [Candidatus Latescibacterota bacterium]